MLGALEAVGLGGGGKDFHEVRPGIEGVPCWLPA